MFPLLFCLLFAIGLFTALCLSYAEMPLFVILITVFFGLLFLFFAWLALKHYMGLLRARKVEPVDAEILVIVVYGPKKRSKNRSYHAVISIGLETWWTKLFGNQHVRRLEGLSSRCLAWIDPQSGQPLEFQVLDKKITTTANVVKVKPDSRLEKFLCEISPLYLSSRHPSDWDDMN